MSATIDRMTTRAFKRAVPLSVSSRSVGIACCFIYRRSATTWDERMISEIMTIHQLYRVGLWLVYYKLVLAQREQTEPCPGKYLMRLSINPEIEDVLRPILEVPSVFSTILDSVGKIATPSGLFHMGIPNLAQPSALARSLLIFPVTMQQLIKFMSNPDSDVDERRDFVEFNSIPGARFSDQFLLENPDDIWPANAGTIDFVANDIHAYKNWISRVRRRLPQHFFVTVNWSGKAKAAGLWSTERIKTRVTSSFTHIPAERARKRGCSRAARHTEVPAAHRYITSEVLGCGNVTFWACDRTNDVSALMGCSSMVGEMCHISGRFEENGRMECSHNPVQIICNLSDA